MKRLGVVLALCALLFAGRTDAQLAGGLMFPGPGTPASSGGGCSQATTFLARTSGLSGTETTAYTNLICGLVTDGVWTNLDALWIMATSSTTNANLNLVSTSFTLANGTAAPTFSADHGYTGNGTTQYLTTSYNPFTAGGVASQNSLSLGAYLTNNRTTDASACTIGGLDVSSNFTGIYPLFPTASTIGQVNNGSASVTTVASAKGLTAASRTAASGAGSTTLYKFDGTNNGSIATDTAASVANSIAFFILAQNNNGTAFRFSADTITAAFVGNGLNSTQMAALASRINAYMTALGINVY